MTRRGSGVRIPPRPPHELIGNTSLEYHNCIGKLTNTPKGEYARPVVVLAELPDWLDVDFALNAALVLTVVAVLIVLFTLFFARSLMVRVLVIVLMGAAVFGLMHYRNELQNCDKNGCPCRFLG